MKCLILLCVMTLSTSAFAARSQSLECVASGKTYGIIGISAETTDLETGIGSQLRYVNGEGSVLTTSQFHTSGSIDSEFQVAPDFETSPNGIKSVFLVAGKDGAYSLVTRTYCNFYYQEETCQSGEILDESVDAAVKCILNPDQKVK